PAPAGPAPAAAPGPRSGRPPSPTAVSSRSPAQPSEAGTTASTLNGSPRNWARPITVTNCPTEIRPVSADQPARMAIPQASRVLTVLDAARYAPWVRAARRVALSD